MAKAISDVTDQDKKDWKAKHNQVKQITVTKKDGSTIDFIVGRPTRSVLDSYALKVSNEQPKEAREVLQANCILAGDTTLFATDVNLESTVMGKITEMLDKYTVEEKEL